MADVLDKNKVVLGMSGGVDSATAALLLKEQGFEVIAFWFDVLGGNESGRQAAYRAAKELDIAFYDRDVSSVFSETVISNFCNEYLNGRTPNPCILCNPTIKFKYLLELADEIGAYYIATGHYAKTQYCEEDGLWHIKKAMNEQKDQSYMLYRLAQGVISRLLLPLEGFFSKQDVRGIARENNLRNADLKDSQEICFIPKGLSYIDYIKGIYFPNKTGLTKIKPGNFIDAAGNVMDKHQGLINYTVGQRKGLGVTFGKPMFVTRINPKDNTVTLGSNEDLFTNCIVSKDNYFSGSGAELPDFLENEPVMVKIRYTAKPAAAVLRKLSNGRIKADFAEKQRAATPGQSMVFYLNDIVVGGGFIEGEM